MICATVTLRNSRERSLAPLIVNALVDILKKGAKRYRSLLEVQIQAIPKFCLTCGSNPHLVASVIDR
jgi:hypothetical protein